MLGDRVASVASDLRTTRTQLAQNEVASPASGLIDQAASYADRVAAYLREADGERLIADAEGFAERNPVVATGIAVILGLSAARFFKASAGARRSSYPSTSTYSTSSYSGSTGSGLEDE